MNTPDCMSTAEIRSRAGDIMVALSSLALDDPELVKRHATYHDALERLAEIVTNLAERLEVVEADRTAEFTRGLPFGLRETA